MCLDLVVFGIVTFLKQLIKISINGKPNLSLKELNTTIYAYKIVNTFTFSKTTIFVTVSRESDCIRKMD